MIVHACTCVSRMVREGSGIINRTSVDAVTIGDVTVILEPMPEGADYSRLMRHEKMHTVQCARQAPRWARFLPLSWRARLGAPRQVKLYLEEWLKNGYWNNKFEIEARDAE